MTEPQRFLIYQSENGSTHIDMMLARGFFEQHCALFHYSNALKQAARAARK